MLIFLTRDNLIIHHELSNEILSSSKMGLLVKERGISVTILYVENTRTQSCDLALK